MPRGRSTATARRASGNRQNTLSFNSKVTKPGSKATPNQKAAETKAQKLLNEPTSADISASESVPSPKVEQIELKEEEAEKPTTADLAIREQTAAENLERTAEEEQALKISDARVKKYWKAKEDSRISPRVHQEGLTIQEKVLREFDLNSHFGPCIGIPRTKRWKRAHKFGLSPPIEVLAVLMKEEAKQRPSVQRAYIDELMSGKTLAE